MTVGKLSVVCWSVFVVMSLAFLPVGALLADIGGPALAIPGIAVLWWGPFGYAMYLALVGMQGDKRLLKRGVQGVGTILDAKMTGTRIQTGGGYYSGKVVRRYRVRVEVPGWEPYETIVRSTQGDLFAGDSVTVYAAPHNRKRVAMTGAIGRSAGSHYGASWANRTAPPLTRPAGQRDVAQQLADLASMHRQGEITDDEFAKAKAQLLRDP